MADHIVSRPRMTALTTMSAIVTRSVRGSFTRVVSQARTARDRSAANCSGRIRYAEMFRGRAVVSALGVRLFGHARLAQALVDPFVLLPVLRARQCEGNRRKATECRYPRVGISLQIGGERGSCLVGAIQERVGRGQESVGCEVFWIGVEGAGQRVDGLLVPPEQNESVPSSVQPGPSRRVARTDTVGLDEPLERLLRPPEIYVRQADLLVGPRFAGILHDDRLGYGNGIVELALRAPKRRLRLQGHEVRRFDRASLIEQQLRLAQPFVIPGFVVTVQEFEYERGGDAGQAIDAGRLNRECLLEQAAGFHHRGR